MHNYNVGDIVTGNVTGIKEYGVFVKIDDTHDGLIHISEISDYFISDINSYVKLNDLVRVKVISTDNQNRLQLSIKQLGEVDIKRKKTKIVETSLGFSSLKKQLDDWIKSKI